MRVIRVTTEGWYRPRTMSYWANAFVSLPHAYVFASAGISPRFFKVDIEQDRVEDLGSPVPYGGEAEGWHFRPDGKLYVLDGPRFRLIDPFNVSDDHVEIDITESFPDCILWQPHSSDDGRVLSATVKRRQDGAKSGTVLKHPGGQTFYAPDVLDESHVTRDGAYLVIEDHHHNRVITVVTGDERVLPDADGALSHLDCGHSFAVGENNQIGACVYLDLPSLHQRPLFSTWNMGYVSVRGDRCLHSGPTHISLVDLQSGTVTPLLEHGGGADYDNRVKASLSPCGRVATYMRGGDVYLLIL